MKKRFGVFIVCLMFCSCSLFTSKGYDIKLTAIPGKSNISIDGYLEEMDWKNANTSVIEVDPNWTVTVRFMQDDSSLYFAFLNLKRNDSLELYPEVLLDTGNEGSATWDKNDWWFHTSYSNCENTGKYNDYSTCKKGAKNGWTANNFPLKMDQAVEIQVDKSIININESVRVRLAFDVTDTQDKWFFYPKNATLEQPATWLEMRL